MRNGLAPIFFNSSMVLRKGFPLSPLLFLIIAKGLSRLILDSKRVRDFYNVKIGRYLSITHL